MRIYTDYRRMLAEAPVTAVNDFTPHAMHHRVGEAALGAGKDLLTEKPMAVSVRAARRMCERAEANGCVLGVFQSGRYMPRTRQLRWLFDSGRIGRLQMMFMGSVGARWAPDLVVADTPWRHRRVEAGGITLDVGVHRFDLVRALAGDIRNIQARIATVEPTRRGRDEQGRAIAPIQFDAEDTVFASFETDRGATGELVASWAGRGGAATLGPGEVFYASGGRVAGDDVTFEDGTTVPLTRLYEESCPAARKALDAPLGLTDTFALAQHEWLEAIRHRRPPETSGRDALASLACAFAALESARAGRCMAVADVLSGAVCDYQRELDDHHGIH